MYVRFDALPPNVILSSNMKPDATDVLRLAWVFVFAAYAVFSERLFVVLVDGFNRPLSAFRKSF